MMTSSNGNIFRVTNPLCGEFTGNRRIPRTKARDAELWCFLWSVPEQTVEQTIVAPVIWDAIVLIMTSDCDGHIIGKYQNSSMKALGSFEELINQSHMKNGRVFVNQFPSDAMRRHRCWPILVKVMLVILAISGAASGQISAPVMLPIKTHCSLCVGDLGQHRFRLWRVDWWHQAITWTNVDLSSKELLWYSQDNNSRGALKLLIREITLRWRHNDHAGVSNHQPHGCLLNRLFRRKSKKTSKLRVTGLCAGNSPVTGEFPAQMASYAENVSIWWRHHENNKITATIK